MYYALHRKFKKYEMTITFWLIRTPDKAKKFGRSAGVRLNEVLLYLKITIRYMSLITNMILPTTLDEYFVILD